MLSNFLSKLPFSLFNLSPVSSSWMYLLSLSTIFFYCRQNVNHKFKIKLHIRYHVARPVQIKILNLEYFPLDASTSSRLVYISLRSMGIHFVPSKNFGCFISCPTSFPFVEFCRSEKKQTKVKWYVVYKGWNCIDVSEFKTRLSALNRNGRRFYSFTVKIDKWLVGCQ